jgi:predicted dehydrogenase
VEQKAKRTGPVTAVLCGAGSRGREAYGNYAKKHPHRLKFIAIADPNEGKRHLFQQEHGIPDDKAFESWETLLSSNVGKIADAAFICTPDQQHFQPAMRALDLGYDIVLEKPIAPTLDECRRIVSKAEEKNRLVQVCHVLRFTPFWQKVHNIITSGRIGKIVHYDHSENVSYWHMAHSFVRGNYKNQATSTPMILAKCCHDMDLIYWNFQQNADLVQSLGDLTFYRPENAPEGAPDRCTDGCLHAGTCPWYAPRMYFRGEPLLRVGLHVKNPVVRFFSKVIINHPNFVRFLELFSKDARTLREWDQFPATHLTTDLTREGKLKALQEGPYGRCVFKAGNDVVDHQITTFTFPDGTTGTLTMHGLSEHEGRELRVFGTKGVLRALFRYNEERIEVTDFRYTKTEVVHQGMMDVKSGHGGGDWGLMNAFTAVMLGEKTPEEAGTTDVKGAMESHYMGFAAEEARLSRQTLPLTKFRS